uniref:Succinate dehydrogenase subunit 3 n=1 Tax=Periphykon beckeri TaxID=2006982 RepID=UPI0022FD66C2|nr:Succinate dehydrogenase subunit 3 [Periphykon beckeri]WAX04142.1 Succinate dehydrogenase subunit 3 [Periphykon beckeri]
MSFSRIYFINPFSPHLTIYLFQFNSILSILHRITGLILIIFIILILYFYLNLNNIFFYSFLFLTKFYYIIIKFFQIFLIKCIIFHLGNGLKKFIEIYLIWNFNDCYMNQFLFSINMYICLIF